MKRTMICLKRVWEIVAADVRRRKHAPFAMPARYLGGVLVAASLVLAIASFGWNRSSSTGHAENGRRVFKGIHGRIEEINLLENSVRIAHEEVPGYMPAMTMSLTVKPVALLKGFSTGDAVSFQLVVTKDDSWIGALDRWTGATAAKPNPAETSEASEALQAGETVPDFQLLDQNAQPIRLSQFRGKAVLITFIYTRCPLPNYCPLMSKNFEALQARLEKEAPGRFELLSISIDPAFDRPGILRQYASRFERDASTWSFATGTTEQIGQVAEMFGLFFKAENGLIAHDLRTALIGPDGKLVHVWKSNMWTPYEVSRFVRESLQDEKGLARK